MKIVPMHKQRNKKYLAGQASLFAVGRQYAARPKRMKKRKVADVRPQTGGDEAGHGYCVNEDCYNNIKEDEKNGHAIEN